MKMLIIYYIPFSSIAFNAADFFRDAADNDAAFFLGVAKTTCGDPVESVDVRRLRKDRVTVLIERK